MRPVDLVESVLSGAPIGKVVKSVLETVTPRRAGNAAKDILLAMHFERGIEATPVPVPPDSIVVGSFVVHRAAYRYLVDLGKSQFFPSSSGWEISHIPSGLSAVSWPGLKRDRAVEIAKALAEVPGANFGTFNDGLPQNVLDELSAVIDTFRA